MTAPLKNIRVIEVTSFVAAPSCGVFLADMGADVIKVEPLEGDAYRGLTRPAKVEGPFRTYDLFYDVDNRGKRSIAVALDTPQGIEAVHKLVAGAQIFICNLLVHRQEKFNLDPKSLFAINPTLVHATLTGYGTTGPEAWRPGFDVTAFFGRSGLYDAMREGPEGVVPNARPAQGDHTTGMSMTIAVLAALRAAEQSGEGQAVETSLYETAIWTQASDFSVTAIDKAPVRKRERHNLLGPLTNRYPCGDGKWVVLNCMNDADWPKFCRIIGRDDWAVDESLETPAQRFLRMSELVSAIDESLNSKARDEWGKLFDEASIIWGPVMQLDEVPNDPQAKALGIFPEMEHPEHGPYRTVNLPIRFHNADVRPRGPAQDIGANTREILKQAGCSDAEIDELIAQGAVAQR